MSFAPHRICVNVLSACMVLAMTACVWAQTSSYEGKTVTAITIKNNRVISTETIMLKLKTKVGEPLSNETLNDDLKRLYATDYFTDVSIEAEEAPGGVAVIFTVDEKAIIESVTITGNKVFREPKLKSLMKSKPDEMFNPSLLAQDVVEIRSFYVKKGYPLVQVKSELETDKTLNKVRIIILVDEKVRVKVDKVIITGNKSIPRKKIVKVLGTKPAWLFNQGVFNDDQFQDDLEKVKMLYDDEGFLDAAIAPTLQYSEDSRFLTVIMDIKEGQRYLVGDITMSGNFVLPEKDLWAQLKLKKGKPFSNRGLRADIVALRQYYSRYGYMNAVVNVERDIKTDTATVDLAFSLDGKDIVYVGKIDIRGNTRTKEMVVRRELRVYPGGKFDGDKVKRSKERLFNLGIFEDVTFDNEETEDPNVQDLVVNVKEAKTGEFSFGGGYSSIDKLMGFAEISQRNFDIMNWPSFTGAGQRLAIRAEVGTVRQNYNISWTEPWIFGFPYSFGFDLYQYSHRRATDVGWPYDERRTGGDLRLGKEITEYLRADAMYRLEEIRLESVSDNASKDLRDEVGSNMISSGSIQLTQDTRDNIFSPTRGYVLSGIVEDAGGVFGGDKNYVKGSANASAYHAFFEKIILEVRGRAGWSAPYGDSNEVPIYERFFAGGANTIRGYRERMVGPRDPGSDDPIGGEAMLIGNAEVTFPIYENIIKGAVFYDIGNVWRRSEDFMTGGYKAGTGVGLRVKTPIGPFSIDYGYPLSNNGDEKKEGQFYFSVSRGF